MNDLASILADGPLAHLLTPPAEADRQQRPDEQVVLEQETRAKRKEILVDLGIPEKHAGILASRKPDQTFAIKTVRAWLAGDRKVLVLLGPHDAGKTFAAAAALSYAFDKWVASLTRGPAPRMVPAELLHKAWLHRGDGLERCTRANDDLLLTCPLLVIDDLAQEPAEVSHITIEAVDTLLRARSDAGRRTLITSNLVDLPAFLAHVAERGKRDQRVGERLTEYGAWRACPVEGYRRRSRGEEGSAT